MVHVRIAVSTAEPAADRSGAPSFDLLGHLPSPVGVLGPDGRFREANRALCRLLGYDPGELLRRWPGTLAHPDEHDLEAAVTAALGRSDGSTVSSRRRYLRAEGLVVTVDETRTAVPGPDGEALTLLQAIEVLPDPPDHRPAPTTDADLATAMVEAAGCVVVVADRTGVIQRCNRAAGVATGRSPAELVGLSVDEAFPPPPGGAGPRALVEATGSRAAPGSELEAPWLAEDDTVRMMAWSASALTDHQGRIDRVVITGVDVTTRHAR
jgi:PAS domain S-box-containing protein